MDKKEKRDYSQLLPTTPPDGLVEWVKSKGCFKENLLIYKTDTHFNPLTETNVKAVKLTCTACKQSVFTEKVENECCHGNYSPAQYGFVHPETKEDLISGNHCLCPECGAEVLAKHVGNIRGSYIAGEAYPLTISRFEDKLVLTGWLVRKTFTKDGDSNITVYPYEAYVVEEKSIIRLCAYENNMGNIWLANKWAQRKKYHDHWGETNFIYPWNARLLIGSTAENSKLNILLKQCKKDGTYPITYLRLWLKHKNIENLVMQGASKLIADGIHTECQNQGYYSGHRVTSLPTFDWVNWKENSPSKMLGMTKEEYKMCIDNKWDTFTLGFWQDEKAGDRVLSADDMKLVQEFTVIRCIEVRNTMRLDYLKVARYLHKQNSKDKKCDFHILSDYWRIARDIGSDMSLPSVQLPPNLMRAHDRVEQLRKEREEAKKSAIRDARKELFKTRHKELYVFAWENDGILIRPVKDENELIQEGNALNHCVGSYAERHATGKNAIFLVRLAKKPKTPWYTLDFNEKKLTVNQNRGKHNCARTAAVEAFEKAWLAWIKEWFNAKKPRKSKKKQDIQIPVQIAG